VAHTLVPLTSLGADVTDSLRDRGVVEHILDYINLGTASLSRFDRYSHILPTYLIFTLCNQYQTAETPECNAHYAGGHTEAAKRATKQDSSTAALDYLLGK
jgi:hypothetical protein